MTPADIRTARQRLGLSRADLADRLGVSVRTVEEWERSDSRNRPQPYLPRAFRDLERELVAEEARS